MPILEQGRYEFTDRDFEYIRGLVHQYAGINLTSAKRELVYARLSKRIRLLKLKSFREYCEKIEDGDQKELVNCINAITTNVTYFFREIHHFDFLSERILPVLKNKIVPAARNRLRIWSAGCSTGEEPYSIEMTLKKFPEFDFWDTKILATDLDSDVLNVARVGVYRRSQIEKVPPDMLRRWFRYGRDDNNLVRINPELQRRIHFKQLNLNSDWPMRGPFDVIFCRNVVIYFDKQVQKRLFSRFADYLADDGYLIIGHSENLFGVSDRFVLEGRTIYRKK